MADHDQAAGEMVEKLLQHGQRLDVQVVGRLVEKQHVGLVDQGAQQVKTASLAAAQTADRAHCMGRGKRNHSSILAASIRSPSLVSSSGASFSTNSMTRIWSSSASPIWS